MRMKKILDRVEKSAIKRHNWLKVPNSKFNYFYIDIMRYKGRNIVLSDGTIIKEGDYVGEIHVDNNNMPEVTIKNIKSFTKNIDEELNTLANACNLDTFKIVKAFFGRTILFPFVVKKGFQVMEIQKIWTKLFVNFWDGVIRKAYTKGKINNKVKRNPKEVWISKEALIKSQEKIKDEKETS